MVTLEVKGKEKEREEGGGGRRRKRRSRFNKHTTIMIVPCKAESMTPPTQHHELYKCVQAYIGSKQAYYLYTLKALISCTVCVCVCSLYMR